MLVHNYGVECVNNKSATTQNKNHHVVFSKNNIRSKNGNNNKLNLMFFSQ